MRYEENFDIRHGDVNFGLAHLVLGLTLFEYFLTKLLTLHFCIFHACIIKLLLQVFNLLLSFGYTGGITVKRLL